LEALLEFIFCIKPPNFGVETHMEALAGVALRRKVVPKGERKKRKKSFTFFKRSQTHEIKFKCEFKQPKTLDV
jgi:hypothetical protein